MCEAWSGVAAIASQESLGAELEMRLRGGKSEQYIILIEHFFSFHMRNSL